MRAHFPNNPRAPLVLVYDFAALLILSGGRPKLASAQTRPDHIPDKTPLLANTKGDYGLYLNFGSFPFALDA